MAVVAVGPVIVCIAVVRTIELAHGDFYIFTHMALFCSHNCDGGMQEFRTAAAAVEKACEEVGRECSIESERLDDYPIVVKVINQSSGDVLWEKDQRRLFRKYGSWRQESITEIEKAVTGAIC